MDGNGEATTMAGLVQAVSGEPAVAAAVAATAADARGDDTPVQVVVPPGLRPATVAAMAQHRKILVVVPSGRLAEDFAAELGSFLDPATVVVFPSWETLPHERLSPRGDTMGRRVAALRRIVHPDAADVTEPPVQVVLAPVRAALQPLVPGLADLVPVSLHVGDERDITDLAAALAAAAYQRVDMVEKRGEFAVRGGIVDVFSPHNDHPVRVEFFGDTVESIRAFSVADQRSLPGEEPRLWAPVVRELLLTEAVQQRAKDLMPQLPGALEMLGQMAQGIAVEGMESLTPALVEDMELLLDVLPGQWAVTVVDSPKVAGRACDLVSTSEEFAEAAWSAAAAGSSVPLQTDQATFWEYDAAMAHARKLGMAHVSLDSFGLDNPDVDTAEENSTDQSFTTLAGTTAAPRYRGDINQAVADMLAWTKAGHAVIVTSPGKGSAQRIAEQLIDHNVPTGTIAVLGEKAPEPGIVSVVTAPGEAGFCAPAVGVVLLTESDLMGRAAPSSTKDMRRMPSRRRNQVDPLALQPGDYVVHEQHGVGRFVEMAQRMIGGATREYLVVEYAPSRKGQPADRLFVPSDALDQVSRYVGGEAPSVNKLGGADWTKTKARARKAVREIAGELIRLYSARMASKGHAFGPDTPWQRELEEAFAYVETPDQLVTIDEVKADMEKPLPMDRLICGDVGYGKTEIAVRAAFKAIQDGKQVAVLVPTTLLVQQHYDTFSERFSNFPARVRPLSRFQDAAESEETLAGIADGSVDVVIGTHRLLSASVQFKNLGLVIVDEEQRFGVEHKEKLKQLRTNVDVLAMSATPIPRTLEMAVTGIRQMSVLATPPEERHPVLTYVGGYDEKTVVAAVKRELLRDGQVFIVHNRVETIEKAASRLRELLPQARVETAHGKMSERRLEDVIVGFWEKRFDVLVCTTIVETGLDIANANTLIVERANVMGLSQLHQLRGRVGRGRERAYAYFLYPPETELTEEAHDRLATIAQNTDLGAGMAVAMKDLEIRGAGNLLGGQQSGHIAGVGFDLYVRLVGEAIAEFSGEVPEKLADVKLELPVDAHLPHSYVSHERLRLEAYRKLSAAVSDQDVAEVAAELADRYGQPPEPVEHLFAMARVRVLARQHGLAEVAVTGPRVKFAPVQLPESAQLKLNRLYPGSLYKESAATLMVPKPKEAHIGGQPLRNKEVLEWAAHLIRVLLPAKG